MNHHQKDGIKMSKFSYVTLHNNQAVSCQRSPKFHANVSNSEMPSVRLQSNKTIPNLVNWLILMWSFLWWAPIFKTHPQAPFELQTFQPNPPSSNAPHRDPLTDVCVCPGWRRIYKGKSTAVTFVIYRMTDTFGFSLQSFSKKCGHFVRFGPRMSTFCFGVERKSNETMLETRKLLVPQLETVVGDYKERFNTNLILASKY